MISIALALLTKQEGSQLTDYFVLSKPFHIVLGGEAFGALVSEDGSEALISHTYGYDLYRKDGKQLLQNESTICVFMDHKFYCCTSSQAKTFASHAGGYSDAEFGCWSVTDAGIFGTTTCRLAPGRSFWGATLMRPFLRGPSPNIHTILPGNQNFMRTLWFLPYGESADILVARETKGVSVLETYAFKNGTLKKSKPIAEFKPYAGRRFKGTIRGLDREHRLVMLGTPEHADHIVDLNGKTVFGKDRFSEGFRVHFRPGPSRHELSIAALDALFAKWKPLGDSNNHKYLLLTDGANNVMFATQKCHYDEICMGINGSLTSV